MRPGIIFANLLPDANELKRVLGLQYWVALSPRSLMHGAGRGIQTQPRVILLSDPNNDPIDLLWHTYKAHALPMFNYDDPTIYRMQRIAP